MSCAKWRATAETVWRIPTLGVSSRTLEWRVLELKECDDRLYLRMLAVSRARRTGFEILELGRAAEALSASARSRAIVGPVMLDGMPAPVQWASLARASQWLVPTAYSTRTRLESSCRADAEPPFSTIPLHTDKGDQPRDEPRPRAPYLLDSGQQPMQDGGWRRQSRQTGSVGTDRWI
jgi:hypothetical protein